MRFKPNSVSPINTLAAIAAEPVAGFTISQPCLILPSLDVKHDATVAAFQGNSYAVRAEALATDNDVTTDTAVANPYDFWRRIAFQV